MIISQCKGCRIFFKATDEPVESRTNLYCPECCFRQDKYAETIALDHVVPFTVLNPQSPSVAQVRREDDN